MVATVFILVYGTLADIINGIVLTPCGGEQFHLDFTLADVTPSLARTDECRLLSLYCLCVIS